MKSLTACASSFVHFGDLQAELEYNQKLIADFGEQKNLGLWLRFYLGHMYTF